MTGEWTDLKPRLHNIRHSTYQVFTGDNRFIGVVARSLITGHWAVWATPRHSWTKSGYQTRRKAVQALLEHYQKRMEKSMQRNAQP